MSTMTLFGIFGMGHWELVILLVIILLLFGHRLPSMMRNMGRSVSEFKQGIHEDVDEDGDPAKVEEASS